MVVTRRPDPGPEEYLERIMRHCLGVPTRIQGDERDEPEDLRKAVSGLVSLLDALLNNPFEKVIITDTDGNIVFINDAYCSTVGLDRREVDGRHVLEVLGKHTRLHIVGKTLKAELHGLFRTYNRDAVARRYPLLSCGRVFGVLGKDLFDNLDDLFAVARSAQGIHKAYHGWRAGDLETGGGNRAKYRLSDIITRDPRMTEAKELARAAARTTSTVLLQGETGVGKELFAHAIHRESHRASGPFVRVNCSAIPETLLESELFGYEEGAFTGARKGGKPGKFELAHGGTIFLDEIGELPRHSQVKLLRVLQEKEVERVGGTCSIPVDVRVVAATNRDLYQYTREGGFRQDLYYRVNVVAISIPPLRERPGDIPLLVSHFIDKYNAAFGMAVKSVSRRVLRQLERYHWPGNVRELESVIEAAMNRSRRNVTVLDEIGPLEPGGPPAPGSLARLKDSLRKAEKELLLAALNANGWDIEATAATLGISVASVYRKMTRHSIR